MDWQHSPYREPAARPWPPRARLGVEALEERIALNSSLGLTVPPGAFYTEGTSASVAVTATDAPGLVLSFSASGLPLSMQITGRPFDDATVLRVAHAYEQATPWRERRPQLAPDAQFSTAAPPLPDPEPAQIDAATRDRVAIACRALARDKSLLAARYVPASMISRPATE